MSALKQQREQQKQERQKKIEENIKTGVLIGEVAQMEEDLDRFGPHAGRILKKHKDGKLMADYRELKNEYEEKKKELEERLGK